MKRQKTYKLKSFVVFAIIFTMLFSNFLAPLTTHATITTRLLSNVQASQENIEQLNEEVQTSDEVQDNEEQDNNVEQTTDTQDSVDATNNEDDNDVIEEDVSPSQVVEAIPPKVSVTPRASSAEFAAAPARNFENILIEVPPTVDLIAHREGRAKTDINFSNFDTVVYADLGFKRLYEVTLKDNTNIESEMARLRQSNYIVEVHPNFVYRSAATSSNACDLNGVWHLGGRYLNYNYIREFYGNNRVLVGVVDTGVSYTHVETKNIINKELSYNFVGNNTNANDDASSRHGTHVASIIGGVNMGLNRQVDIVSYKVLDQNGSGSTVAIARAVIKAQQDGVPILNMSLGMPASVGIDKVLYAAIANYSGIVIAASGNSSSNVADYPAGFDLRNIISVNSIDENKALSWFSHKNATQIDLAAYGGSICAADGMTTNGYIKKSGSSMATPMVSAAAAMLLTVNPNLSPIQIKNYILDGTDYDSQIVGTNVTNGILDIVDTMSVSIKESGVGFSKHYVSASDATSITVYGLNDFGQLGAGDFNSRAATNAYRLVLPNNEQILKYFLTRRNTFIISKSGSVYVAGDNSVGQANNQGGKLTRLTRFASPIGDRIVDIDFRNRLEVYDELSIRYIIRRGMNAKYIRVGEKAVLYRTVHGTKQYGLAVNPIVVTFTNNLETSRDYFVNGKYYNREAYTFEANGTLSSETFTTYRNDRITSQAFRYKNGVILSNTKEIKNGAGKLIERNALTYSQVKVKSGKKYVWRAYKKKQVITNYNLGVRTKETTYNFNKIGQLRTNNNGKASRKIVTYKNGRAKSTVTRNYTAKGKLAK